MYGHLSQQSIESMGMTFVHGSLIKLWHSEEEVQPLMKVVMFYGLKGAQVYPHEWKNTHNNMNNIQIHAHKHIHKENKQYRSTDKQAISKQICRQRCISTPWQPIWLPKLFTMNEHRALEKTSNSLCPEEHYVTIICLILRVKAAQNLPETRKYCETKVIGHDSTSTHWLRAYG